VFSSEADVTVASGHHYRISLSSSAYVATIIGLHMIWRLDRIDLHEPKVRRPEQNHTNFRDGITDVQRDSK